MVSCGVGLGFDVALLHRPDRRKAISLGAIPSFGLIFSPPGADLSDLGHLRGFLGRIIGWAKVALVRHTQFEADMACVDVDVVTTAVSASSLSERSWNTAVPEGGGHLRLSSIPSWRPDE